MTINIQRAYRRSLASRTHCPVLPVIVDCLTLLQPSLRAGGRDRSKMSSILVIVRQGRRRYLSSGSGRDWTSGDARVWIPVWWGMGERVWVGTGEGRWGRRVLRQEVQRQERWRQELQGDRIFGNKSFRDRCFTIQLVGRRDPEVETSMQRGDFHIMSIPLHDTPTPPSHYTPNEQGLAPNFQEVIEIHCR